MAKKTEPINEFIFTWKIENFSSCAQKNGEPIDSPEFAAANLNGSKWFLTLYPSGTDNVNQDYISCYIHRNDKDDSVKIINLDLKIELLNACGLALVYRLAENIIFEKDSLWLFAKLMNNRSVLSNENLNNDSITVRCYLTSGVTKRTAECVARTKINVDRCSFKWELNNFDNFIFANREFSCIEDYRIDVTTTSLSDDLKIIISKMNQTSEVTRSLICRMALVDVEGNKGISKRSCHLFDDQKSWEFPVFIKKSFLKIQCVKYLKNNSITLFCDFSVANGRTSTKIDYIQDDSLKHDDSNLNKNLFDGLHDGFQRLFICQKLTDVKLVTDSETFQAHTSVLSAQSPVFSTIFEQKTIESQTIVVDVPDVDSKTLKYFLCFLYTGLVEDMDDEKAMNLLMAADKYQVLSLKEKCSSFLMSILSDKNVCKILQTADITGHGTLKAAAVTYIKETW